MGLMDDDQQDDLDAAWHDAEQHERRRFEDELLADDPGYRDFLIRYEASTSGN
jgi:hypothetical protein